MHFTVRCTERDGVVRLALVGELDLSTVGELNDVIDRLIGQGHHRFLVDLRDLAFCDSTGMSAFLRGDSRGAAGGGWLRLTGAGGRVARVLRVSGLDEVLRYGCEPDDPVVPGTR